MIGLSELRGQAAAQEMGVPHATSLADAVEEFEDVDRLLAPAADFVAG